MVAHCEFSTFPLVIEWNGINDSSRLILIDDKLEYVRTAKFFKFHFHVYKKT